MDYTALPVPFGTIFFTSDTLRYMWDRRRTCSDFFTEALVARGCPITQAEVEWWMNRFGIGPVESLTYEKFLSDFFIKGYTLTHSLYPKYSLSPGSIFINGNIRTTMYDAGKLASIHKETSGRWKHDFYVLKFPDMEKVFGRAVSDAFDRKAFIKNHDSGFSMHALKVAIPPDQWVARVDNIFARLLESTCAEDYLRYSMDRGELLYSSIRPFIPPEKYGSLGLTENPWGIPVAVMKMLDAHSREWPGFMQQVLDGEMPEFHQYASSILHSDVQNISDVWEKDKDLTLAYAIALKRTVAKFAKDDLNLQTIAENFYRFAQNIARINEELRDAQDKAFTASIVGMVAGMALGFALGPVFGPYVSQMSAAVGQVAGNVAAFVTQQIANAGIKQITGMLVSEIVSVPEFDPPRILQSLPMPKSPITPEMVGASRSAAQGARTTAQDALALARSGNAGAPQAIEGAFNQAKSALAMTAETRDPLSQEILMEVKAILDSAVVAWGDRPAPVGNVINLTPDEYSVDPDMPQVVTAGAQGSAKSALLGLLIVGFALAIPMKEKK